MLASSSHENDSAGSTSSPRAALLGHACQRSDNRYHAHRSARRAKLDRAEPSQSQAARSKPEPRQAVPN